MSEVITPAVFNGVGVVSLLVALFWLLATGRLATRREVDDVRADRDAWRETAQESKDVLRTVVDGQETAIRLLRAIPHVEDRS